MKRKVLGKGLEALLPSSTPDTGNGLLMVDIDLLSPHPRQPRTRFDAGPLEELASSIRQHGIVQPIVVRRVRERFEIIAGERRWRAAQLSGMSKVPVAVLDVSEEKVLELALLENIQRVNLNPIEEARAYGTLMEEHGWRHEDLAERLGKARTTISNCVRLLNLPVPIQTLLEAGQLSAGQARPLLSISNQNDQLRLAEMVVQKDLSARDVEKLAVRITKSRITAVSTQDPNVAAAEERLTRRFGTRVHIEGSGKGGRIVIHFASTEELNRIFETLMQ